ncbi:MAG: hypothetical protein AAGJ35_00205 [Myxococcota bacterium]
MSQTVIFRILGWIFCGILLGMSSVACVGEGAAGQGEVLIVISGGQAMRQGFPHMEGEDERAFKDGWTLRFEQFIVSLGRVVLRDPQQGKEVAVWSGPHVVDVRKLELAQNVEQGVEIARLEGVPARRLDIDLEFQKPTQQSVFREVSAQDKAEILEKKLTFLITGTAEKDGKIIRFRFGLSDPFRSTACTNGEDGTRGLAVQANKKTTPTIFLHSVHMFVSTLRSGHDNLRFEPFVAMASKQNLVTSEDLKQQSLLDLKDRDGNPLLDEQGNKLVFDDQGLLPPNRLNLLAYLELAVRDSIHFNITGLCKIRDLI